MDLMEELSNTIRLVEAEIPANPNSMQNEARAKSLERSLRKYFDKLEQAFPYKKLEQLYSKHVKE